MQDGLFGGGLYEEQHAKSEQQKLQYEADVNRRNADGEVPLSFEDWLELEREEEEMRKEKAKEERESAEQRQRWEEDNADRTKHGLEALSFDDWCSADIPAPKPKVRNEVINSDDLDLDDDERTMLSKKKDYYHGRLGTILSNAAPKPERLEQSASLDSEMQKFGTHGSAWNNGTTLEFQNTTVWAKDRLSSYLQDSSVESDLLLPNGKSGKVSAKVSKVQSLSGDAQIVMKMSGKKGYGYNFEVDLAFVVSVQERGIFGNLTDPRSFESIMKMPDLMDGVPMKELRMEYSWTSLPEELHLAVNRGVELLQEKLRQQVSRFVDEYQQR